MSLLRKIYYRLPPKARYTVRRLVYLPADLLAKFRGNDELIPPKGMIFTGGGDFKETGERFLRYFKSIGKLQKDHSVLDIGSGIGRMAIPLTKYLSSQGSYRGFDMVAKGVDWCKAKISSKFPNFEFRKVDLINDLYSEGENNAENFVFPYADESFDLCIAISVYTHLVPAETANYLKQTARVLRPGGRAVFTFFVYEDHPTSVKNGFGFKYVKQDHAFMDDKVKSANVAYRKNFLTQMISDAGLRMDSYYMGKWQNNNGGLLDFQDIIVLEKV